jgi:hypothetical protein
VGRDVILRTITRILAIALIVTFIAGRHVG